MGIMVILVTPDSMSTNEDALIRNMTDSKQTVSLGEHGSPAGATVAPQATVSGHGLDGSIGVFFRNGVKVSLAHPRHAAQFLRTVRWQAAAGKTRKEWRERGVPVPPIVIFSITHRCNLRCVGCYAYALHGGLEADSPPGEAVGESAHAEPVADDTLSAKELTADKLESIVAEAVDLGVSFFVIAGGEPFMRPELLDIAARFPRVVFLVFTNGLLLDGPVVERLAQLRNVVCLLSLEGGLEETDRRRGEGTYARLTETMNRLKDGGLFFGCSLTLNRENFHTLLADGYIRELVKAGGRFMLFLEYTPVDSATVAWALTESERAKVPQRMRELRSRFPALFIAVPWDEEDVGGCLAAGRGFIHINASGDVEPCPFAPYSDVNLTEDPLRDALSSPFLASLRAMPHLLQPTGGGCALWKNRQEVEKALAGSGRRTH